MQKRILVVDDDTMNLLRTKMILEKEQMEKPKNHEKQASS